MEVLHSGRRTAAHDERTTIPVHSVFLSGMPQSSETRHSKVALAFARVAVPVQVRGERTDKINRDNLKFVSICFQFNVCNQF